MEEEGGISWPLVEGSEINPISCFPTIRTLKIAYTYVFRNYMGLAQ